MNISMLVNACKSNGKTKTSQLVFSFPFFNEQMCWLVKKQEKCAASLVTESTLHKIISKEMWDLFITSSVADSLPPLVLTDWPFAALASSHRWHLHLSWPECWGGERPKHPNNNTSQRAAKWIIWSFVRSILYLLINHFTKSHFFTIHPIAAFCISY